MWRPTFKSTFDRLTDHVTHCAVCAVYIPKHGQPCPNGQRIILSLKVQSNSLGLTISHSS
jgi:hypothetical protein